MAIEDWAYKHYADPAYRAKVAQELRADMMKRGLWPHKSPHSPVQRDLADGAGKE